MRRLVVSLLFAALLAPLVSLFVLTPAADAQQQPETSLRGELAADDEPVEGVTITVERDGDEIDEVKTDEDGAWKVELDEAGIYTVTIDPDTLPDGIALRDPENTSREVRIRLGQNRPVLFALGEGAASGAPSRVERMLNLVAEGIRLGLVLALCSVGLSLIYGVTGLTNFAHGELVTLGALLAWFLSTSAGGPDLPLLAAAPIAVALGGGTGFVMERGMFAPLRRRRTGNVSLIVFTIGLSLVLRHVFLIFFRGRPRPLDEFTVQRAYEIGPIRLQPKDYVVSIISAIVLVLVGVLLQRTRLGTAMRAVADDRDLAEASGIDVQHVITATWVLGAALAALGGVLQGVSQTVVWDMGYVLLLLIFAAVVLGGIGTAYGAMAGGIVLGVASQVSTYWLEPKYRTSVALAILIVVILVRPQGILGRRERVG